MGKVPKQFFPDSTRLELNVELRLPEGASLHAINGATKRLEAWLAADKAQYDDHDHYITYVGTGSLRYYLSLDQQMPATNVSQLVIRTRDERAREALRGRLLKLFENDDSGVRANIARVENGPPVGYPVQYRVSGEDPATLRRIAGEVAAVLRARDELSNVNLDWSELSKAVEIEVDQDKSRLLGVSGQELAALLNMSLNGLTVTSYREGEKTIDVVLRGDRAALSSLPDLAVPTRSGKSVPLNQIARLKTGFEPGLIWRRDRQPTITVRANLYGTMQPDTLVARVQPQIDEVVARLPEGYLIAIGGSVEESLKGSNAVMAGIPVFILVVVTILMIQLSRNDFFGPMAVAIMGGLIVATALTLLFLPALYAAWYTVRAD